MSCSSRIIDFSGKSTTKRGGLRGFIYTNGLVQRASRCQEPEIEFGCSHADAGSVVMQRMNIGIPGVRLLKHETCS